MSNADCGVRSAEFRMRNAVPPDTQHATRRAPPWVRRSRFKVRGSGFAVLTSIFSPCIFFLCGLMSKTMVVTLPLILLLLDWWPLKRMERFEVRMQKSESGAGHSARFRFILHHSSFLLLEKLPFLAASLVCGLLTVRAEKAVGAMQNISDIPLPYRIANATLGGGRYLAQMVWPRHLAVFYPYPRAFALWPVVGAGLLLLLVSVLVLRAGRRWPYLAFGWLWYGVTHFPVAGIIQVGSHHMRIANLCASDRSVHHARLGRV